MSRYRGTLELKQSYQKNLILGLVSALAVCLCCLSLLALYPRVFPAAKAERIIRVWTISQLINPPPPPEIMGEGLSEKSSAGTIRPVPKVTRDRPLTLRTQYRGETYGFVYDMSTAGIEVSNEYSIVEIGTPQQLKLELIPTDRMPECVHSVMPRYPDLARQNGVEGEVWLQVLVSQKGKVKDVNIFRKSRIECGFEEAVSQVAWEWEYRPALCNNQPVAVWIVYTIKFKLKPGQVASR